MLTSLAAEPLAWPFAEARRRVSAIARAPSPTVEEVDRALSEPAGVRFVPCPPRGRRGRRGAPRDLAAYDASIALRAEVPTRDRSPHDLANALVWATFPRAKAAVHQRQLGVVRAAAEAAPRGPRGSLARSEEGDALAMLDEGGLLVAVAPRDVAETQDALVRGDDAALAARVAEGRALGVVFGHAIVEHLGRPAGARPARLAGLAVALPVAGPPPEAALAELDARLAELVAQPGSFQRRRGHGIATVTASVLGTRAP